MADSILIRGNDQNEYWVQIRVEGHLVNTLIDTGLTSPDCLIGVGLDTDAYLAVKSNLRRLRRIEMEGIGNRGPELVVGGLGTVSIERLDASHVETYVAEVEDNLLGVCYFHNLVGYEVVWELGAQEITVRKIPT